MGAYPPPTVAAESTGIVECYLVRGIVAEKSFDNTWMHILKTCLPFAKLKNILHCRSLRLFLRGRTGAATARVASFCDHAIFVQLT